MARPKGSKNKPKIDFNNIMSIDEIDDLMEQTPTVEDVDLEEESDIIPITEMPTFGIKVDKYGFLLYSRRFFEKETITQHPVKGIGMVDKVNPAGSYSSWDKTKVLHYSTMEGIYMYLRNNIVKENIKKKGMTQFSISMKDTIDAIREANKVVFE